MTEQPPGWSFPDPRGPAGPAPAMSAGPAVPLAPTAPAGPRGRSARGVIPLRPLGLGELLDGSVTVVRRYPKPVLAASAAVAVVGSVLQLFVTLAVRGSLENASASVATGSSDALPGLLGTAAVATGLNVLVSIVTGAVLAGVVTAVVGRAVFGQSTSVHEAWEVLRPRLLPLVVVSFVVALTTYGAFFGALGVVALVAGASGAAAAVVAVVLVPLGAVVAVGLYVRWSLAPAAVVLEKQRVRGALRRSSVLVARSFWRVLGVLLLAALIVGFVGLVLQLPLQLIGFSPLRGIGSRTVRLPTSTVVTGAVTSALVTTVVAPFTAGVRALLYLDRRMRAEGLDVTLNAAAAEAAARA